MREKAKMLQKVNKKNKGFCKRLKLLGYFVVFLRRENKSML
jgi:hypothetical protein